MNKKQLIIALIACALLIAAGMILTQKESKKWQETPEAVRAKLIDNLDVNAVEKIVVSKDKNSVTLQRQNEKWQVSQKQGYPADFKKIKDALMDLLELKVARQVPADSAQLPRLELVRPGDNGASGTLVELFAAGDKPMVSVLLGKAHMSKPGPRQGMMPFMGGGGYPDGRYVMVIGKNAVPALVSNPLSSINPDAAGWLDKDFLKIENIKSVQWVGDKGWTLRRDDKAGTFRVDGMKADEGPAADKISDAASAFNYVYFSDVAKADSPVAEKEKPEKVLIETFDGFNYDLALTKANGKGGLRVKVAAKLAETRTPEKGEKPEDKTKKDKEFAENLARLKEKLEREKFFEAWRFEIPVYKVDSLLKARSEFVAPKKKEEKADTAKTGDKKAAAQPQKGTRKVLPMNFKPKNLPTK